MKKIISFIRNKIKIWLFGDENGDEDDEFATGFCIVGEREKELYRTAKQNQTK